MANTLLSSNLVSLEIHNRTESNKERAGTRWGSRKNGPLKMLSPRESTQPAFHPASVAAYELPPKSFVQPYYRKAEFKKLAPLLRTSYI